MNHNRHHTAETIYTEVLRQATSERNMYFTYLDLKAGGEDRQPTAVEAMTHFLEHGGYRLALISLGVEEYPLTSNTAPEHRAEPVKSD